MEQGMPEDQIRIKNLQVFGKHGLFPEEQKLGQKFCLNITLDLSTRKAGQQDDMDLSVHYGEVSDLVVDFMHSHTYYLIEAVAEHLAEEILLEFPLVKGVTLEIEKPWAPVGYPMDTVSVIIERKWHCVYVALGSNMGDRKAALSGAVSAIEDRYDCKDILISDFRLTKPYGGVPQEDFLNGAMSFQTLLTPEELLDVLHEIEASYDRIREIHWGPRTLDLDILFYDDLIYESDRLTIPHIDMENRAFVLEPLCDLCPNKRHPVLQKTVKKLLETLEQAK